MIDLKGKVAVVFGLANKRSIAWAIAQKLSEAGATLAICYQNERLQRDAEELAAELPQRQDLPLRRLRRRRHRRRLRAAQDHLRQARHPRPLRRLRPRRRHQERLPAHRPRGLPHRPRRQRLLADRRRPRRRTAHDRGRLHPHPDLLRLRQGLPQLQRHGRRQGRARGHRALPRRLSRRKNIRVNAISAGPIKTLAARGIGDFTKILNAVEERAPLHRNVDALEVGNTALFLSSDLASGITGEITFVDCGFNVTGL